MHAEKHMPSTMIWAQWKSNIVSEKSVNFVFVFLEEERN